MSEIDWILENLGPSISWFLALVASIIAIWAGIRKHRSEWLHLVPLCQLQPKTFISPLKDPGRSEYKDLYKLNAEVEIHRHGGMVLYPKFSYILTYKNTKALHSGVAKLINATPVISKNKGGPWSFEVPPLTENDVQSIEYLYLMLECYDQLLREYVTIARFKYVFGGWAWNKVIFTTQRKKKLNKYKIKMFKKASPKWIKKYGNRGTLVQDWSDLLDT